MKSYVSLHGGMGVEIKNRQNHTYVINEWPLSTHLYIKLKLMDGIAKNCGDIIKKIEKLPFEKLMSEVIFILPT